MKLRIKDSAVRFRLTLKEVEMLGETGLLEKETWVPGAETTQVFRYAIRIGKDLAESRLLAEPFAFVAEISAADFAILASPDEEGIYVRREWETPQGERRRFMVFVEKDRPGSTCVKPEEWIYEEVLGARPLTRPIGKPALTASH